MNIPRNIPRLRIFSIILLLAMGCQPSGAKKEEPATPTVVKAQKEMGKEAPKPTAVNCTYTVKAATPKWTAYKYTEKAPVSGTFNESKLGEAKSATSLSEALIGLTMAINPASVESNNPARNTTIATSFFNKFMPATEISAKVDAVKGNDSTGRITISVNMNSVSKALEFDYTMNDKGVLEAKKSVDMIDFNLKAAYDGIHEACKGLHTGKDGVAKTWTDVELAVTAQIEKKCN